MPPIKVSILTLTGARPEAFKLCTEYVTRQRALTDDAHYSFEWVIVDDGPMIGLEMFEMPRARENFVVKYVSPPCPRWFPGKNTFVRNLYVGLANCTGEVIAFMEDDDWYSEHYLLGMLDVYRTANVKPFIIGSAPSTYYNVRTRRFCKLDNTEHASLCETILCPGGKEFLENILLFTKDIENPFIDVALWESIKRCVKDPWLAHLLPNSGHSLGIKGMPGRPGIGIGHHSNPDWTQDDDEMRHLQVFIGTADALRYKEFYEQGS